MHERGDPLPLHLGGGERGGQVEAPQPLVQLHGSDDVHELSATGGVPAGAPGSASPCAASIHSTHQRRRETQSSRIRVPQGVRRLPAGARYWWTVRLFDPQPFFWLHHRACYTSLRKRGSAGRAERQPGARQLGPAVVISGPRHDVFLWGVPSGQPGWGEPRLGEQRACVEALVTQDRTDTCESEFAKLEVNQANYPNYPVVEHYSAWTVTLILAPRLSFRFMEHRLP